MADTTIPVNVASLNKDMRLDQENKILRCIAAYAINQLCGPVSFDDRTLGEQLFKIAVEKELYVFDAVEHASKCPANHDNRKRLPTGHCTCGALETSSVNQ